jgi:lipoprotein-anchoring transpeptidase ErfK/SrfK
MDAMRKLLSVAVAALGIVLLQPAVASASVVAKVSLSTQTMTVVHDGVVKYHWKVSTTGAWHAKWLSKNHRSSRYNNAPMPYAIFFNGHYAVHGTDQVGRLGRRASSGCIRLHPKNAAVLFDLAQREGLKNTRIVVSQ